MNYAFMTFSCPELTLDQVLALARKYGYDGIELRISANHQHGVEFDSSPATRKEAGQKAKAAGIRMACVATSCVYADPAKTAAMIEDTHQAIDLAGDIGAPRIRVFGGVFPETVSREQAIEGVARALTSVADHAQQRQVIVCLETHDAWCDPAHVAAVIRKVNHPAIGVNWDIMHPVNTAKVTVDHAFTTLKSWIRHVHFHDGNIMKGHIALCPIGQGIVNHRRTVQLLKTLPYPYFLSGEWIGWEPYDVHLPRELATMRGYEAEK
ncbi:MAG: sugar phosphate isomerase/epimerase [Verrucomicrobia bacterium]|nr:sugar phosphate isomerase/epimerase [Verrucomicrobiota bacterium]MBU4247977.1 sugar phosphate isomerase/epimerase [Verrucomicrobiota bacterium]MBU4291849.1 sugar phosphate isomerase/epimerase [Verrucomicrobiota bacterium]MBU4497399.1 sugar phosphate isomerase/epimerase [Verrucomicrobiota bacterium]MCG2681876.1 sugar phosphate isomerase/epimerase [Kiritimatiellia bacterium]